VTNMASRMRFLYPAILTHDVGRRQFELRFGCCSGLSTILHRISLEQRRLSQSEQGHGFDCFGACAKKIAQDIDSMGYRGERHGRDRFRASFSASFSAPSLSYL